MVVYKMLIKENRARERWLYRENVEKLDDGGKGQMEEDGRGGG